MSEVMPKTCSVRVAGGGDAWPLTAQGQTCRHNSEIGQSKGPDRCSTRIWRREFLQRCCAFHSLAEATEIVRVPGGHLGALLSAPATPGSELYRCRVDLIVHGESVADGRRTHGAERQRQCSLCFSHRT